METIRIHFSKIISWLFCIVCSVILLDVIFVDGDKFSINRNYPIISVAIGIFFAIGAVFLYHKLNKKQTKKLSLKWEIIIVSCIMLLFLLLGIYIVRTLWVYPSWDVGHIYEAAISKATQGNFGGQYEYMSNFPFQTFLVYAFALFLRITAGLFSPQTGLMLLNLTFILGAIIFFYFSIRKLFQPKIAILSLVLFLIFSPILLYSPIFYSDTISMFFVMACFYLSLHLCDKDLKISRRIIISLIFGVLLFCGFQIKATVAILAIALLIFIFLIKKKTSIKSAMVSIACISAVFIPTTVAFSLIRQQVVDPTLEVPKTHWIMMGLKGYGGFNTEDYVDVTFPSLSKDNNRPNVQTETIKTRLGEYGFFGYLNFLSKKLSYTWGDGTYFVPDKLRRSPSHPDSTVYQFVVEDGKYFQIYNVFMNGMQIMLLVIITIGGFLSIKDRSIIATIKLTVLGLVLFLLIWETRSRYIINYLPLLLVYFVYSLIQISNFISKRKLFAKK